MSTIDFELKPSFWDLYWNMQPSCGLYGRCLISLVGNWEERMLDRRGGRTFANDEISFASDPSDASDTRHPVSPLAQLIRSQVSW